MNTQQAWPTPWALCPPADRIGEDGGVRVEGGRELCRGVRVDIEYLTAAGAKFVTTKAEANQTHAGMSQFWAGAANHPTEFRKLISGRWPELDDSALLRIGQSRRVLAEELMRSLSVSQDAAELQIVAWERLNTGG